MHIVLLGRGKLRELVERRGCVVSSLKPLVCTLRKAGLERGGETQVVAIQPNKWHPADVIAACTLQNGGAVQRFKVPAGLKSTEGFNEAAVAELLAAAGIAPYCRGKRGFALRALMCSFVDPHRPVPMTDNKNVRLAVKAVADAGLAKLTLGERGGFSNARLKWQRSRIRALGHKSLTAEQEEALRILAAA